MRNLYEFEVLSLYSLYIVVYVMVLYILKMMEVYVFIANYEQYYEGLR